MPFTREEVGKDQIQRPNDELSLRCLRNTSVQMSSRKLDTQVLGLRMEV